MDATLGTWSDLVQRIGRTWRTARHIPAAHLAARARLRALEHLYDLAPTVPLESARRAARGTIAASALPRPDPEVLAPGGWLPVDERAEALAMGRFAYLGREADYTHGVEWKDHDASPLWLFQLHYLGSVLDLVLAGRSDTAARILGSWSVEFSDRWDAVAWHPYTLSLRLTNLLLATGQLGSFERLGTGTLELAATHAAHLLRHLENDLRGNHVLENALALLLAGRFLSGPLASRCDATAREIYTRELPEQILSDGGHFELSPMYHVWVLHRLLIAIAALDADDPLTAGQLAPAARAMSRFLEGILCPDGEIPLVGDSARGYAPPARSVLRVAQRLVGFEPRGATAGLASFHATGLHVLRGDRFWALFDTGPVCAPYLPGHGQADSLTLEVWCDGRCVVTDPGVHEYTGAERAWGRSSRAHSTITLGDADSSEVYGSFRVGGRAAMEEVRIGKDEVRAAIRPFGSQARLARRVALQRAPLEALDIADLAEDAEDTPARSRLHLAPAVRVIERASSRDVWLEMPTGSRIRLVSEHGVRREPGRRSPRFGTIEPTTILVQSLAPVGDRAQSGGFRLEACS